MKPDPELAGCVTSSRSAAVVHFQGCWPAVLPQLLLQGQHSLVQGVIDIRPGLNNLQLTLQNT